MAKYTSDKAARLFYAAKTRSLGATKNTIRILHGGIIVEDLEYRDDSLVKIKKGYRSWIRKSENRAVTNAALDISVNYFGFNPLNPEVSLRNIDFNKVILVLVNLGYGNCVPELNKLVEVMISLKEMEELDTCASCKRPYIVPVTNDTHCPRCRSLTMNSAITRYSKETINYEEPTAAVKLTVVDNDEEGIE